MKRPPFGRDCSVARDARARIARRGRRWGRTLAEGFGDAPRCMNRPGSVSATGQALQVGAVDVDHAERDGDGDTDDPPGFRHELIRHQVRRDLVEDPGHLERERSVPAELPGGWNGIIATSLLGGPRGPSRDSEVSSSSSARSTASRVGSSDTRSSGRPSSPPRARTVTWRAPAASSPRRGFAVGGGRRRLVAAACRVARPDRQSRALSHFVPATLPVRQDLP